MRDHLRSLVRGMDPLAGRNVVREYLQARILEALQRAGAMSPLAFQGGTALRFLYGLPRYSEDLDFALEGPPELYDLAWMGRRHLAGSSGGRDTRLRARCATGAMFTPAGFASGACYTTRAFRRTGTRCWVLGSMSTPTLPRAP